jgi:uncharacterized protein YjiK
MNFKILFFLIVVSISQFVCSQVNWPGNSWYGATNLTALMNANGITGASGLHWNGISNRLYLVQDTGRLRVLQFQEALNSFVQIGNVAVAGDLEGITQANLEANEFYVVAENEYQIRRYTHNANFTSVTLANSWNLLQAPSPMINTGNDGPEGITFVPDSWLQTSGFLSSQTGQTYISTKGMGGLIFIAHQDGGYVWAFDINPNQSNDFLYVGKYKTSRTESCGLSFDSSTGLLYILHNIGDNFLEVTDLTTNVINAEYVFTTVQEYFIPFAMDNKNIEGVAISNKCPNTSNVNAFLCRDTANSDGTAVTTDVLRWFQNFGAPGNCDPLSQEDFEMLSVMAYPNPTSGFIFLKSNTNLNVSGIIDFSGKFYSVNRIMDGIDMRLFPPGVYWLIVEKDAQIHHVKVVKH